jgi:hypothetical protein
MTSYLKPLAAAAAVMVLAIAGWSLLPSSPTGPAAPSPTATASPSPTPRPRTISGLAQLEPGRYRHLVQAGSISLTIPSDDWWVEVAGPLDLALSVGKPSGEPSLRVFADMYRASKDAECRETPEDLVGMTAADLVADFAADDQLDVSTPTPVTIDGFPGQLIDVGLAADATRRCPAELAGDQVTVPLIVDGIPTEGPFWGITAADRERFVILDMPDGGNLVIVLTAAPDVFAEHVDVAMPVVESLEFEPKP